MHRLLSRSLISAPRLQYFSTRCQSTALDDSFSYDFETLQCTPYSKNKHVMSVAMNRPEKMNAVNQAMWREIGVCFNRLSEDPSVRAIVISGNGKAFCAGIDLQDLSMFSSIIQGEEDIARKAQRMYKIVKSCQDSYTSLEKCKKPVIAAVHGICIGAATNLICGADIRYSTTDAWFQIKEVELGIAPDVGAVQRLPKIIGSGSLARELALSARKMLADEAHSAGLISRLFKDKESLMEAALGLADEIAKKSPVAVQGTKKQLNYARDHTVDESLEYQACHNMTLLQSEDLLKSVMAQMTKTKPEFNDY